MRFDGLLMCYKYFIRVLDLCLTDLEFIGSGLRTQVQGNIVFGLPIYPPLLNIILNLRLISPYFISYVCLNAVNATTVVHKRQFMVKKKNM